MKRSDIHTAVTATRVEDAVQRRLTSLDNPGFCTSCGAEADGCEPDAEGYECEVCGEPAVYGADELYMRFFS
jgi:predicted amidophosphoribosyltransferase